MFLNCKKKISYLVFCSVSILSVSMALASDSDLKDTVNVKKVVRRVASPRLSIAKGEWNKVLPPELWGMIFSHTGVRGFLNMRSLNRTSYMKLTGEELHPYVCSLQYGPLQEEEREEQLLKAHTTATRFKKIFPKRMFVLEYTEKEYFLSGYNRWKDERKDSCDILALDYIFKFNKQNRVSLKIDFVLFHAQEKREEQHSKQSEKTKISAMDEISTFLSSRDNATAQISTLGLITNFGGSDTSEVIQQSEKRLAQKGLSIEKVEILSKGSRNSTHSLYDRQEFWESLSKWGNLSVKDTKWLMPDVFGSRDIHKNMFLESIRNSTLTTLSINLSLPSSGYEARHASFLLEFAEAMKRSSISFLHVEGGVSPAILSLLQEGTQLDHLSINYSANIFCGNPDREKHLTDFFQKTSIKHVFFGESLLISEGTSEVLATAFLKSKSGMKLELDASNGEKMVEKNLLHLESKNNVLYTFIKPIEKKN